MKGKAIHHQIPFKFIPKIFFQGDKDEKEKEDNKEEEKK